MRYLFWAIWYPAIYWILNALTTVVAIPIGIAQLMRKHRSGRWESPGRNSKLTPMHRRQTSEERRTYYQHREASKPRIATVAIVTAVFWGAWMYFIAPLLSIFLWFGGIYLFTDRMIAMGGYHVFTEQLVNYATAIFAMAATLSAWVTWNKQRYGRREKRHSIQRHISDDQMSEFSGLDKKTVNDLRKATSIVMHYHDGHPVIEKKAP